VRPLRWVGRSWRPSFFELHRPSPYATGDPAATHRRSPVVAAHSPKAIFLAPTVMRAQIFLSCHGGLRTCRDRAVRDLGDRVYHFGRSETGSFPSMTSPPGSGWSPRDGPRDRRSDPLGIEAFSEDLEWPAAHLWITRPLNVQKPRGVRQVSHPVEQIAIFGSPPRGSPLTAGNDHRIADLKDIASELAEVHQSARWSAVVTGLRIREHLQRSFLDMSPGLRTPTESQIPNSTHLVHRRKVPRVGVTAEAGEIAFPRCDHEHAQTHRRVRL
jgi:hypothetical protein